MLAERERDRAQQQVRVAHAHLGARRGELRFQARALAHFDLRGHVEVRHLALALRHPARHGAADLRQLFSRRPRRSVRRRGRRRAALRSRRRRPRAERLRRLRTGRHDGSWTARLGLRFVSFRSSRLGFGARPRGLGLRLSGLGLRLGRRRSTVPEQSDLLTYGRRATFVDQDFRQHARALGLELHVGLVGLDLGQHVADIHLVSGLFQPTEDLPLLHGVTELRHHHIHGRVTSDPHQNIGQRIGLSDTFFHTTGKSVRHRA